MIILHDKILENWDVFPYKLDYILHLVFTNNPNISDLMLKENNGKYILCLLSTANNNEFDSEKFSMTKEEITSYLKIKNLTENSDFRYQTEIFKDIYSFRTAVKKTRYAPLIVLRSLNLNTRFNEFSEKMYGYSLHHKLKDTLFQKQLKEIKIKI